MIAKKRFNKHYHSLNSTEKNKALTLLFILSAVFIFCLLFSLIEIRSGLFFQNPGYYIIGLLSPVLALVLLFGYYRLTVYTVLILFTLVLSFSQLYGEYREIEILTFILLISFASIYAGRKASFVLMVYCFFYLVFLYFMKRDVQTFSPFYLSYSLFFLIVISIVNSLNSWILERNISSIKEEVQKQTVELNEAKDYAELIFHNNPSAAYTVDQNGKILDFNTKAEELTGYGKHEIVGVNETVLMPRMEKSLSEYHFDKSGESIGTLISKEGREKTVARYAALLTNDKREITGKIVSVIDLTEWREFERYKADMERVIRHDLKTPLNSVIGFPNIMLQDESLKEEYREYLSIIQNAGITMRRLIEASRYLYKIEEGTYEPDPEETDILAVLRQIDADLTELKSRRSVNLNISVDGIKPGRNNRMIMVTEKILFQMILSNLIKNAMEASPSNNDVSVMISTTPHLSISIHNLGLIPMEIRERFFDKYVTINKKSGTGLGTYSAKIMSLAIGAELTFSSREPEGTKLELQFKEPLPAKSL